MGKCGTPNEPNLKAMAEAAMAFSVEPVGMRINCPDISFY
jgi:hypothetical protein